MEESNKGAEYVHSGIGIARFLRDHGVKYVFGIPDGLTMGLYRGLKETEGISHILFNDERNTAYAADAYGRITGTVGVCVAGPAGGLNLPIGLAEAKGSSSPILALVGLLRPKKWLRNFPHEIDIAGVLNPVTKWTEKIIDPINLPRFLRFAFKQALSGKPGPVALVISEEVVNHTELKTKAFSSQISDKTSVDNFRTSPIREDIDTIVEKIINAKQPAIFCGEGSVISKAYNEVATLAQILKAPVFTTISGKGIMVSKENPIDNLYFGPIGLFGQKPNHGFMRSKVDLLIAVGNRLTEDDTAFFKFPSLSTEMIQIGIEISEIGLSYNPIAIMGDPKTTLNEVIINLQSKEFRIEEKILETRLQNLYKLNEKLKSYREKDRERWLNIEPIKPERVLKAISDNLDENDYFVTDASASLRYTGAYFPVKGVGRRVITPRGIGPTGFGVGALIGTCFAAKTLAVDGKNPKKVLLTGDGSLMDGGLSELETIGKLGLDCTIIILNNNALGYIKFAQAFIFNREFYESERPDTKFSQIAELFGGKGYRVEKLSDLDSTIKEAINRKGFSLVEVMTDPEEFLPPSHYHHEWDYFV
jgi:acetolactate synthase-1/2/3 large subunit